MFLMEQDQTQRAFNELILKCIFFILKHNWIMFKGFYSLQVQGVAMGTCCALAYANLYLEGWEQEIFA